MRPQVVVYIPSDGIGARHPDIAVVKLFVGLSAQTGPTSDLIPSFGF